MSEQSMGHERPEHAFKTLVDARTAAGADLKEAKAAETDAFEELKGYLEEQTGNTLPLKGKVAYKRSKKYDVWLNLFPDIRELPPEEYCIGDLYMDDEWVVEVSRPAMQDYERYGIALSNLGFAQPEEIAEYRAEKERILEYARSQWVGSVATNEARVASTNFPI